MELTFEPAVLKRLLLEGTHLGGVGFAALLLFRPCNGDWLSDTYGPDCGKDPPIR